jgi:hypothetical protein
LICFSATCDVNEWNSVVAMNLSRDVEAMKYNTAALTAFCFTVCMASANLAEAGGGSGRSVRIDDENGKGCMSTYLTANTETSPSGVFTSAAGNFIPGGKYLNATTCTPDFAGNPGDTAEQVLFPDGPLNGAAQGDPTSLFLAASGTMYQYFTGALTTTSGNATPDAQVSVWNLKNSDTEIEMNGWCPGTTGASFKFDGNTFAGGCATGSAEDLLFNSTGGLIGFVSYTNGDASTAAMQPLTKLTGWTENGVPVGGSTVSAPEIDASSAIAALTLLFGGLAVLRGGQRILIPVR